MSVLVTIAVVAGLCLVLGLLLKLVGQAMSTFVWGSILLIGFWVVGNILLIVRLEALGKHSLPFRWAYHAWSSFFFYTGLLQAVVFITLTFWSLSLVFRPALSPPESMQEFVLDFVRGSSALAALVFLSVGAFALTAVSGAGVRLLAVVYLLLVAGGAVLPWIPRVPLSAWVASSPPTVFWSTIAAYALLSAAGMALYARSMDISP